MDIDMSSAVLEGDCLKLVWRGVRPKRQQWRARRSAGRILAPLPSPPRGLLRRSFQSGKGQPHREHQNLHPHRFSRFSRKYKLFCGSLRTGKGIQRSLTERPAH